MTIFILYLPSNICYFSIFQTLKSSPSGKRVLRIVNGTLGDSVFTMTSKPYKTPVQYIINLSIHQLDYNKSKEAIIHSKKKLNQKTHPFEHKKYGNNEEQSTSTTQEGQDAEEKIQD